MCIWCIYSERYTYTLSSSLTTYIDIYIYIYIHVYICKYIYIYIHIYLHIRRPLEGPPGCERPSQVTRHCPSLRLHDHSRMSFSGLWITNVQLLSLSLSVSRYLAPSDSYWVSSSVELCASIWLHVFHKEQCQQVKSSCAH